MRYVRGIAIAVVVLLASVTVIRALTVTFPNRAAARVVAVVDELGNVLFGSKTQYHGHEYHLEPQLTELR
jgi:hypothetical protein